MSDKRYYCAYCDHGTDDASNFKRHELSDSHNETVVKGKARKLKIVKKTDYTVDNFIPLRVERDGKDTHFYEDDPNGLNIIMTPLSACKEFLRIIVTKHKLDQGFLI